MKKAPINIIILLLCVVVTFALLCISASAKESDSLYYGREALSTLDNADALLYAYDAIVSGVEQSLEQIEVYNGRNDISTDEIKTVFDAYIRDRSDQFWIGNRYTMSGTDDTVIYFIPEYVMSGDALTSAREKFDIAADSMLEGLDPSASDFEKELYLHDLLAKRTTYADEKSAHNAYGAIVEGKAVCEGYAKALQYLLHRAGVRSFLAHGYSVNPTSGDYESHCWNIVRIDGKYYHVDPTWNDQDEQVYHAYFNLPTSSILADHALTPTAYPLPTCDSNDAMYFKVKGGLVESYSTQQMADRLKDNQYSAGFYISGSMDTFLSWLRDSISVIGILSGADPIYNYSYATLGKEVYITVHTCLHEELTPVAAISPTCSENGVKAHYACECGALFADAEGNIATDLETVAIYPTGHDFDTSKWSYCEEGGHGYSCKTCGAHTWLEPHTLGSSACADCGYSLNGEIITETDTEPPQTETQAATTPETEPNTEINADTTPNITTTGCMGSLGIALVLPTLVVLAGITIKKKED